MKRQCRYYATLQLLAKFIGEQLMLFEQSLKGRSMHTRHNRSARDISLAFLQERAQILPIKTVSCLFQSIFHWRADFTLVQVFGQIGHLYNGRRRQ